MRNRKLIDDYDDNLDGFECLRVKTNKYEELYMEEMSDYIEEYDLQDWAEQLINWSER